MKIVNLFMFFIFVFQLYFFHVPAASAGAHVVPFTNTTAINTISLDKDSIKNPSDPSKFTSPGLQSLPKLIGNQSLMAVDSPGETLKKPALKTDHQTGQIKKENFDSLNKTFKSTNT